jgi:predicted RNA binding protein YcfA (HicA-like mRNA interferase family)
LRKRRRLICQRSVRGAVVSSWPSSKSRRVLAIGWVVKRQRETSHRVLAREGSQDFVFAFHDGEEIGPRMLARIAKRTRAGIGRGQQVKNPGASPEAFGGTGSVRSVAIHGRHGGRPSSSKAEASFGGSDPKGMNQCQLASALLIIQCWV